MTLENNLQKIKEYLTRNNLTLCTVESCTGGTIASKITSLPGSSEFFKGSLVPYSESTKEKFLGIHEKTLAEFGAVSPQIATEMLLRGLTLFESNFCIATTGFMGPTGGTDEYPLGTVFIAYGSHDNHFLEKLTLRDERNVNISFASDRALQLFSDFLKKM